ncbi:hypothetical protein K1719_018181 [Acacia pycnantha]|nr:hypothetical protein K1719_018181 [Acacia pycnantha]
MGKVGASSWLTAVKRAFRSPTKENDKRSSSRRREEPEQDEEEKKRGKRRWIFRKALGQETAVATHQLSEERTITTVADIAAASSNVSEVVDSDPQGHTIAVAMATTAAAQAAVASAQAAVEAVRLARPSIFVRRHYAATTIQTAFRGYLARRALRALKGLVKLQALARGHNVRKRAKFTLQCMQALVRVQTRLCEQRAQKISQHGSSGSRLSDSSNTWVSHLTEIKSIYCRDDEVQTIDKIRASLKKTKEVASKREEDLADAFSQQIWRTCGDPSASEGEAEEISRWSDPWIGTGRRKRLNRDQRTGRISSCDQRDPIKIVEIDTFRPYSNTSCGYNYKPQFNSPLRSHTLALSSPMHKAHCEASLQPQIVTPSPRKMKQNLLQVHSSSASPRCTTKPIYSVHDGSVPNYMAATASAKARLRSMSAPRQRTSSPQK